MLGQLQPPPTPTRASFGEAWSSARTSPFPYSAAAPVASAEYQAVLCLICRDLVRTSEDPTAPTPAQLSSSHRNIRRRVIDARLVSLSLRRERTRKRGALP